MVASAESGRSRTSNKEVISDIIPSLHGYDCELMHPTNMKILRRATLKIDFYLIPIVGMFCESYPLTSILLCAHLPFSSFVILGECSSDRSFGGLNNSQMVAG